jgi:two pore calcium channel protein
LFQGKFEGALNFDTIGNSYYNMHILLTTSNFPDIMLPAYNSSRANCLFFLAYLTFGLYFLLNVLLAVVFENYKLRVEARVLHHRERRFRYIEEYYNQSDVE